MKVYFPLHLCGSNRGCEAIAKGTANQLKMKPEQLIGLCTDVSLDKKLEINQSVTLTPVSKPSLALRFKNKLKYLCSRKTSWDKKVLIYSNLYEPFLSRITKDDIMLSTGGDMMCYDDNQVIYTNNYLHMKGIKTILWGCSMDEKNLSPMKLESLKAFSLIYARESLSFNFFKSLGLSNVCLYPDPAFTLELENCELPVLFSKGPVIGLNLSNYVLNGYDLSSEFGQEVKKLIDYILNATEYNILLIPHVTTSSQDDRVVAKAIKMQYVDNPRIEVLDVDDLNYTQIRYIISNCKVFIGGRTHAVISAYATCTPAIAIGYSIKARGIAKDLGIDEMYVVDSKVVVEDGLLNSFKRILTEEKCIRQHLTSAIPIYKNQAYLINNEINKLLR